MPLFNHGVGASDYLGLLDQPAVKQMLIQWVDRDYTIDNSIHTNWQTHLKNKGYPQQTRNVAISNGSQCALTQGFDPGDVLFGVDGRVKTGWLTDILTSFTGLGSDINSAVILATTIFTFEPGFLFGVLPGNSRLDADIQIRALPELGQTNQVYSANVTFTKKVLWLINITTNIINESFDSPSNSLPYDYYPGGVVSTKISSSSSSNSNALYGLNINVISDPDFVLVPTVSALDIGKGFEVLNNSDYLNVYRASSPPLAPKDSPFVNFITSFQQTPFLHNNFNQYHLGLIQNNGDWLASEINPSITATPAVNNCSFICENIVIEGPEMVCNSSATYNFDACSGTVSSWSISSNLEIISSTDYSVTVQPKTTSVSGNGYIEAVLPFESIRRDIWVGQPRVVAKLSSGVYIAHGSVNNTVCRNEQITTNMDIDGATNSSWSMISSSHTVTWNQQGNNISFYLWAVGHTATFRFTTSNECGSITRDFKFVSEDCSGGGDDPCEISYTVSPTLAEDEIEINFIPPPCDPPVIESNTTTLGVVEDSKATLYDFSGNPVIIRTPASGKMNVEKLSPGHYILVISNNGKEKSHRIIIN